MVKTLKKILIVIVGALAFLCAGVFFVGCGVDTNKIYLSADKDFLSMDVGDETSVVVTIENYQKGFSNKIRISPRDDGKSQVFETSDPIRLSNSRFKINITAIAGGQGELVVKTLEAGKECKISVSVNQNTTSLRLSGQTMYVSNKSPYLPKNNDYVFDPNTTNFNLKHYYLSFEEDEQNPFNITEANLVNLAEGKASFTNQRGAERDCDVFELDKISLEKNQTSKQDELKAWLNGEILENGIEMTDKFYVLSVYEHSLENHVDGEKILSVVSVVNVLPDLNVSQEGKYKNEQHFSSMDLTDSDDSLFGGDIILVPNQFKSQTATDPEPKTEDKSQYLLRVGIVGDSLSSIEVKLEQSNNDVNIDYYQPSLDEQQGEEASGKTYKYILITQNSQVQSETEITLNVFYTIAKDIKDESVNRILKFNIKTMIAPTRISVNGLEQPERLTLYNFYLAPEYGWQNLFINVGSDFTTSPDFAGLYFDFDSDEIDLQFNNQVIYSGSSRIFTRQELLNPFQIRGRTGISKIEQSQFKIRVISEDIFGEDKFLESKPIYYEIKDGATAITNTKDKYYIDYQGGAKNLNTFSQDEQLMFVSADNSFSRITADFVSGTNCVNITPYLSDGEYYTQVGDKYFLNLRINPNKTGTGAYVIRLDNGISTTLTFECIKTLNFEQNPVVLSSDGNSVVTNIEYLSKNNNADGFKNNIIKLEILNPSTNSEILAEQVVNIQIVANFSEDGEGITYVPTDTNVLTITQNVSGKGLYKITTHSNGFSEITFTIPGYTVENFERKSLAPIFYVDVYAYSLVNQFYLENESGAYALNSVLYYGANVPAQSKIKQFVPVAKNEGSYSFEQYVLTEDFYKEIAAEIENNSVYSRFDINEAQFARFVTTQNVMEGLDNGNLNKFIYFYVYDQNGNVKNRTQTTMHVSVEDKEFDIELYFLNGIMFFNQSRSIEINGKIYEITFDNFYEIGNYATFDFSSFEYENKFSITQHFTILSSRLSQRDSTKRFDARISTQAYQEVLSISISNGSNELNFKSGVLTQDVSVFTYPLTATNSGLKVDIIETNNNPYKIVTAEIDETQKSSGIYKIHFSCEDFYTRVINNDIIDSNGNPLKLEDIEDSLTATAYIYPKDWGNVYMELSQTPLIIDIQFRNGNLNNPLLLETYQDVLDIGKNDQTLKSHYEIQTTIDMSLVKDGQSPLGMFDNDIVSFKGTIVGTSSQAALTNFNIKGDNGQLKDTFKFFGVNGGETYAGLFAKIGKEAILENFTISGSLNLNLMGSNSNYISLLSAQNEGSIINVGTEISSSSIEVSRGYLYYGAISAKNKGKVVQDFSKFDKNFVHSDDDSDDLEKKIDEKYLKESFKNQSSRNIAYYHDYVDISLTDVEDVFVGGVAGLDMADLIRISPTNSYKLYNYSGYYAYSKLNVSGNCQNAFVGGIAGKISAAELTATGTLDTTNVNIQNLLVGGEVNCLNLISRTTNSGLGGIVGYADTERTRIKFDQNISRTFLRGGISQYVGGIVGFEDYSTDESSPAVEYTNNAVEAVDDGRNSFYSALIISQVESSIPSDQASANRKYAVGFNGSKDETAEFEVSTYLTRNSISATTSVTPELDTSTKDSYGDYLYVAANGLYSYDILAVHKFVYKKVEETSIKPILKMDSDNLSAPNLYFMYYFSVSERLDGNTDELAQQQILEMNIFSPNMIENGLYPFEINSQNIGISSMNSALLSVDLNGNLTTKSTGLATLKITSVLNINIEQIMYVYIFNYFNKDVSASVFYSLSGTDALNDNSTFTIYGENFRGLQIVPDYSLKEFELSTNNSKKASITKDGILKFNEVDFVINKNYDLTAETELKEGHEYFSKIDISNQTITIWKDPYKTYSNLDEYKLIPILRVEIANGTSDPYQYYYKLEGGIINLKVEYRETATRITTQNSRHSILSNGNFDEKITIESTYDKELVFYEIENENGEIVQSRMAGGLDRVTELGNLTGSDAKEIEWDLFINEILPNPENEDVSFGDLFILKFVRSNVETNTFSLNFRMNRNSQAFKNRFEKDIFGLYYVRFYASQLKGGDGLEDVHCTMTVKIEEAGINYITMRNHSNIEDVTTPDGIVVPSQRGLLEISIDPMEAVFDRFTIYNDEINSSKAMFMLIYLSKSGQYVQANNFGNSYDNNFTFTYSELIDFMNNLEDCDGYNGNIYISYYMPSVNVENGEDVKFKISVTHGFDDQGQQKIYTTAIDLVTKLSSYVSLTFDNKLPIRDNYYLAKGLSYQATLNYYGFTNSDITIDVDSEYLTYERQGERVTFNVLDFPVSLYNSNEAGYKVSVTVTGAKRVDGKDVVYSQKLDLYLMEYVLNYLYIDGIYEDIVQGMRNGVINVAIGTPYALKLNLLDYMEYQNNQATIAKMQNFIDQMSNSVIWNVYYDSKTEKLEKGKTISDENGYFGISSFTVTPRKLYSHESGLYHFSVSGNYIMRGGEYIFTSNPINSNQIYTQFEFDVHEKSSRDSRIPVRNYQELLDLEEKDGEWAILLSDIVLPSKEYVQEFGGEQFRPLNTRIAGLDGNGYSFIFSGTYDFDSETSNVGLFDSIILDCVMQNISIRLERDTIFNMESTDYNIGLLAAQNEGVITNCEVDKENDSRLIVRADSSTSTVAALVASNSGFITNSRSKIDIVANANLSGFVGLNNNHISSSYFKGGSLSNSTSTQNTAGFVLENSGQIYTSYVSGQTSSSEVYYSGSNNNNKNSFLSKYLMAGFAFNNNGTISDCYSNIKMINNNTYISGFVYRNVGTIERSFSTSLMTAGQTSNYGFARFNDEDGVIEDCARLVDEEERLNTGIGDDPTGDSVNIERVSLRDFNTPSSQRFKEVFKNYIISNDKDTSGNYVKGTGSINGIWFIGTNSLDLDGNFNDRLELVAPNIVASSRMNLVRTENIVENGVENLKYVYEYDENWPILGSAKNPILIDNGETFEQYILNETDVIHNNYSFYRLISDVDLSETLTNSQTYHTRFMGYFEGNFMDVRNNLLYSSDSGEYAGLFAEVVCSNSNEIGTVMNFNFAPEIVYFGDYKVVGGVVGKLDGGRLYNINISTGNAQDTRMIEGKNIVGGIVGLAVGIYDIKNVHSDFGAKARYQRGGGNVFDETNNLDNYSYAGSVVGVLSGRGSLCNVETNAEISVSSSIAGLMIGYVDRNVNVENLNIEINGNMTLNGYSYAGLVVGQSAGRVSDVSITSAVEDFVRLKNIPTYTIAFGGLAGQIVGGQVEHVSMNQNINLSDESKSQGVLYVGGIAGQVVGKTSFKDISVTSAIRGYMYVGGVAGAVDCGQSQSSVNFEDIHVSTNIYLLGNGQNGLGAGGLAGFVSPTTVVDLEASTSDENLAYNSFLQQLLGLDNGIVDYYEDNYLGPDSKEPTAQIQETYALLKETDQNLHQIINNKSDIFDYVINSYSGQLSDFGEFDGKEAIMSQLEQLKAEYEDLTEEILFDSNVKVDSRYQTIMSFINRAVQTLESGKNRFPSAMEALRKINQTGEIISLRNVADSVPTAEEDLENLIAENEFKISQLVHNDFNVNVVAQSVLSQQEIDAGFGAILGVDKSSGHTIIDCFNNFSAQVTILDVSIDVNAVLNGRITVDDSGALVDSNKNNIRAKLKNVGSELSYTNITSQGIRYSISQTTKETIKLIFNFYGTPHLAS